MGKSTPAPPPPPDYGEATKEGVYADIETLPTRRKLERAARLGEVVTYEDPRTGEQRTADFTGLGDLSLTENEIRGLTGLVPELTQSQLDNLTTYGPQFVQAQRDQLRQMDPAGFDLREQFAQRLQGGTDTSEDLLTGQPDVPQFEEMSAPELTDSGMTAETRALLEQQIADQLAMGNKLTDEQARVLEQGIRRSAESRGQALGTASGLREAITKLEAGGQLGQQRRGEALGLLASGQSTSDTANRLAQQSFANAMGRVQQVNQSRQMGFAAQQQNLGQRFAARQQDVSNIQSLLGLQPVAAQGGLMAGMQQGAAPYMMPQMQTGINVNPNAGAMGAQFAQGVFGTQANIFNTQSNMKSPFERAIGMGVGLGTMVGGNAGFSALK